MMLQTEYPRGAAPGLDGVHDDERDAEPNCEADGHGYELQRGVEAGEVRVRRAGRLLRGELQQAAVREARRDLEEHAGDLGRR